MSVFCFVCIIHFDSYKTIETFFNNAHTPTLQLLSFRLGRQRYIMVCLESWKSFLIAELAQFDKF